jgi:peptide/nickel transport system permease protein
MRNDVAWYIVRRIVALSLLMLVISFGVFSLLYITPGSIVYVLLGGHPSSPEVLDALTKQYHLDDPFLVQYAHWLGDAFRLDLGRSILTNQPVLSSIISRLGVTTFLGVFAFLIAVVTGIGFGTIAALRKRTVLDRGIVALSVVGVSAPPFATGLLLLYVFGVALNWLPVYGVGTGFFSRLEHLTLPAIALAFTASTLILKLTRAALVEVLEQDYIVFARARGVPRRRILAKYALRNALIPVVTASGIVLAYTLTGAVLIEVTFSLPGLGAFLVNAVINKDVPVVQGATLVIAAIIMVINLLTDVLYLMIDPRIRFERSAT